MKTTNVFKQNLLAFDAGKRYIINQGGTRSSKTYSVLQLLYLIALHQPNQLISVVSETFPHLKRGALRDFETILEGLNYPIEEKGMLNRTDNIYRVGSSRIEFFSADNSPRMRGAARDYLFINEANNLSLQSFNELEVRTRKGIFLDYNPVSEFYIHTELIPRLSPDEYALIKSTYLDNEYLDSVQVRSIESRKEFDPEWWQVYGMGEIGAYDGQIFPSVGLVDELPVGDTCYGLDFGFNNPTALVKCVLVNEGDGRGLYFDEVIYRSELTTADLIQLLRVENPTGRVLIYADPARPEAIEEIRRAGFSIYPANNAVFDGINKLKSHKLFLTKRSVNAIKEFRGYAWKRDRDGRSMEEPIKTNDHAVDAARYGGATLVRDRQGGGAEIRTSFTKLKI